MIQRARAIRDEDKLERRRDILDAAERLFLSRPEGLASMDELAEAAGVAKGTLYLYFPSKEEVLLALHERNAHAVFDAIDREVAAKSKPGLTLRDLSELARKHIIESPIYLPLATLVIGFIGRSIPVESVLRFHLSIMERVKQSGGALERALKLPVGDGARLIEYTHAFVLGLWQLSGCGRIVAENLKDAPPEMLLLVREDPAEIQRALETLWNGMLDDRPRLNATASSRRSTKNRNKRGHKMKLHHPIVLSIFLGVAVTLLLNACAKDEPKPDVVRPVRTMTLAPKNGDVLTFAGEVKPRYETRLAFRVPGQILERRVDVGSVVKGGQVLAVLDAKDLKLAETAASAQLAQAQSQAALAEGDFKRYTELRAKNFISQAEFERREAQVEQARESVAAARAENERFSNQVSYGALLAPHAGVITAIEAEAGQVVAAGQPVARIARQEEREIAFNVPEHLLDSVRKAKDVEVRLWSKPGLSYPGRLRELAPVADSASRTYPARLSIVKGDRELSLGMTAEVRVRTTHAETLRLPLSAIFHQQDRPAVWVVEGDPAAVRLVPVATGAVHGDMVEIASGLTAGQVVVTAGVHMLAPGQKVRLLEDSKIAGAPS